METKKFLAALYPSPNGSTPSDSDGQPLPSYVWATGSGRPPHWAVTNSAFEASGLCAIVMSSDEACALRAAFGVHSITTQYRCCIVPLEP